MCAISFQTLSSQSFGGVKFSRKAVIDVGASDPERGSVKMRIYSNDGLLEKQVGSQPAAPNKITDSDGFVREVGARVFDAVSDLPKGDLIDTVVIFAPGQGKNGVYGTFNNLFGSTGATLKRINFNNIWDALGTQAVPKAKKKSDNTRTLLAVNDMFGVGSAAIEALATTPKYAPLLKQDGLKGTLAMTGGGCGVITFDIQGNNIQLNGTERGHTLAGGMKMSGRKRTAEGKGASSVALIRNFTEALKLDKDQALKIAQLADARVVTQFQHTLAKTAPRYKAYVGTGAFNEYPVSGDLSKVTLSLKGVGEPRHQEAALKAMATYVDGLAQIAHNDALGGASVFIATGPLLHHGVKPYFEANPEAVRKHFGLKEGDEAETLFDKALSKRIRYKLDGAGRSMARLTNFKVISDLPIEDNTAGGQVFANSQKVGAYHNRFRMPVPEPTPLNTSA